VLGRGSDARKYAELHSEILAAFQKTFFQHNSTATTYSSGSQACDAFALDIGAVPAEYIDVVYQHLETSIRQNGTHVTVGEVGLLALVRVLSVARYQDLMCDIMSSTTYPSYGFLVDQGSTSMTEYWDGPPGTGRQDHIILDGGDVWLYSLAGMKQAEGL
jgi:alpha-L-rhamnosidase